MPFSKSFILIPVCITVSKAFWKSTKQAIFIIAVFINYGLQDKHVVRCPSFFWKPHLAIIDHMVFIKELSQSVVKNSIK